MNEPFIFHVRDYYYIRASYPSPAEHRHFAAQFFNNRSVNPFGYRPRYIHANNNNLVQSEQSRPNRADNQTLSR